MHNAAPSCGHPSPRSPLHAPPAKVFHWPDWWRRLMDAPPLLEAVTVEREAVYVPAVRRMEESSYAAAS